MDQLMALGVISGDPDSAAKAFADLKDELAKQKAAWETVQIEVVTLTRVVKSLKISADNFATQIPALKEKVKHLDNKVRWMKSKPENSAWSVPPRQMTSARVRTLNWPRS
jgi:hypothetical protein